MNLAILIHALQKIARAKHATKSRRIARKALETYTELERWGG